MATQARIILSSSIALNSYSPAIAASGNNVYVVWYDDSLGNDDILYRRSTDGGFSFSGIVNLSNNPGGSYYPAIASSANKVYVVWHDSTPGNSCTEEVLMVELALVVL